MDISTGFTTGKRPAKGPESSNVKSRPKYDRFGETIRYLTLEELQKLFDSIEDYRHKLVLRMIYEWGVVWGNSCGFNSNTSTSTGAPFCFRLSTRKPVDNGQAIFREV